MFQIIKWSPTAQLRQSANLDLFGYQHKCLCLFAFQQKTQVLQQYMKKKQSVTLPCSLGDQDDNKYPPPVAFHQTIQYYQTEAEELNNSAAKHNGGPSASRLKGILINKSQFNINCNSTSRSKHALVDTSIAESGDSQIALQNTLLKYSNRTTSEGEDDSRKMKCLLKIQNIKHQNITQIAKKRNLFNKSKYLQQVIKKVKVKNITNNFLHKIKSNKPKQMQNSTLQQIMSGQKSNMLNLKGFQLKQWVSNLISFLHIILTVFLIYICTLLLVYDDLDTSQFNIYIKSAALVFFTIQMGINLSSVKVYEGRKLVIISQIWKYYWNSYLLIDVINLVIIVIDLTSNLPALKILRLFIVTKLPQSLQKLERLETEFNTNIHKEKYWSLIKILIFNFCFAHGLAIILSSMAQNTQSSWMSVKGIIDCPWYQRYVWAYYWGTNIMLTVGFGDIAATNYLQAIYLIFIETFSCMVLAYNISCVGQLMSDIRGKDLQKNRRLKIFKKLTNTNDISQDLNWKVHNYIQQSVNLKKKFNFQEEGNFVKSLPPYLKNDFLKQCNKQIFKGLAFFKNINDRTLLNLAEKIEMRVSHPEETIRHIGDDFNLLILRRGELGLVCRKPESDIHGRVMDSVSVTGNENPKLVSLQFITKKHPSYEIKSLQYSTFYFMQYSQLNKMLKEVPLDYQDYAMLRDKIKNIPDQFEIYKCQICQKRRHYKFDCPSLHFLPRKQNFILKQLHRYKQSKVLQRSFKQRTQNQFKPFYVYRHFGLQDRSNRIPLHLMAAGKNRSSNCRQKTTMHSFQSLYDRYTIPYNLDQQNDPLKQIRDLIRAQMKNLQGNDKMQDNIWLLNCDSTMDYTRYFINDNPSNLNIKFSQQSRKLRRLRKFQNRGLQILFNQDDSNEYQYNTT